MMETLHFFWTLHLETRFLSLELVEKWKKELCWCHPFFLLVFFFSKEDNYFSNRLDFDCVNFCYLKQYFCVILSSV